MTDDLVNASAISVTPPGALRGRVVAPPSKSATNRLLVVAALAHGTSTIRSPLVSDDGVTMRRLVESLGATVTDDGDAWLVEGTAGAVTAPQAAIDCGLSGTTMRFGAAMAALAPSPVTLTGQPSLLRRPIGPLTAALRDLGADAADNDGLPPVTVGGGLKGGSVSVDVSSSSQYASAVALCAPYASTAVDLHLVGRSARAYINITIDVLRRWGADIRDHHDGWVIEPGILAAREDVVEYDASSAAHLLALAVATGGEVTVANASRTVQPDAHILDVFRMMGASVDVRDVTTVVGPPQPRAIDVDLESMPDQVTTVAALATLAPGTTTIRGAAVTRGHESDRLAALTTELSKLGVDVVERSDGLAITGGAARGPARLSTHSDHRLAMAFAAIAARVPDVVIEHPACVTKTYPSFWSDLAALGIDVRSAA